MDVRTAKDYLVEQTARQARIESVPFSDLERRMMYYAEGREATEQDRKLNDEFDSQYGTAQYEAKIRALLHHAYVRVEMEDPEMARQWNEALALLKSGDHYLPILWGLDSPKESLKERPPYDLLKLSGTAILLAAAMFMFGFAWDRFAPRLPDSAGFIARYSIYSIALALYFLGRHYWRKARSRKSSGQA